MDEKKIHSIIDEAMAARDRSVSIYISPDGGVSVSVFPMAPSSAGKSRAGKTMMTAIRFR